MLSALVTDRGEGILFDAFPFFLPFGERDEFDLDDRFPFRLGDLDDFFRPL